MGDLGADETAITTRQVLRQGLPILLVTHDADDGAWQFLNGHGNGSTSGSLLARRGTPLDPAPPTGCIRSALRAAVDRDEPGDGQWAAR